MNKLKIAFIAVAALVAASAHAQSTISLYAADSLRPALDEIAAAYVPARVQVRYGSATALRDGIAAGERPAIFVAADMYAPHSLTVRGLAGPVKRFASVRGYDYGVVLVDGAGEEAWYFEQFILSPQGQAILAKHGLSRGRSAIVAGK